MLASRKDDVLGFLAMVRNGYGNEAADKFQEAILKMVKERGRNDVIFDPYSLLDQILEDMNHPSVVAAREFSQRPQVA